MIQTQKVMFVVPGEPIGKGRPRFRQVGQYTQTYSPKQTVNYESLVRLEYHDDAQIVDGSVIKCYSEQPRIEVEIWEIAEGG